MMCCSCYYSDSPCKSVERALGYMLLCLQYEAWRPASSSAGLYALRPR